MGQLNQRQKDEIEVLDFFGLKNIDYRTAKSTGDLFLGLDVAESKDGISAEESYFDITSRGVKSVTTSDVGRLKFLLDAKRWAMRTCDLYEVDVLDGIFPYSEMLDGIPRSVAVYLSRKLFNGIDRELIMRVYEWKSKSS